VSPELEGITMAPVMQQAKVFPVRARARVAGRVVSCVILLGLAAPLDAQQLTPRQIAARARPAVVLVTALRDGREIGQGSGFVVSADGTLVTNRHVIEGAQSLRVQLAGGEVYDRVFLVSQDATRDLAILRIPATGLSPLRFGDDRRAETGDAVYVMGNPRGLEGTFTDGLVSAKRTIDGTDLIQISAPISPGSSGGPVLNAAGEVIGIAAMMMEDAQNLNIAVAARYAEGLLAMNETPRPFEQAASELASPSFSDRPRRSSGPGTDDVEPWVRVLIAEMQRVDEVAKLLGLTRTHEPVFEMLNEHETYDVRVPFRERGARVAIIGVCDADCSDLDLAIYDESGREVVRDVLADDTPELQFRVTTPGTYRVRVVMAACSREPCAFALQAFVARR
jgi:S1-C subfamily serine protease